MLIVLCVAMLWRLTFICFKIAHLLALHRLSFYPTQLSIIIVFSLDLIGRNGYNLIYMSALSPLGEFNLQLSYCISGAIRIVVYLIMYVSLLATFGNEYFTI